MRAGRRSPRAPPRKGSRRTVCAKVGPSKRRSRGRHHDRYGARPAIKISGEGKGGGRGLCQGAATLVACPCRWRHRADRMTSEAQGGWQNLAQLAAGCIDGLPKKKAIPVLLITCKRDTVKAPPREAVFCRGREGRSTCREKKGWFRSQQKLTGLGLFTLPLISLSSGQQARRANAWTS